MNPDEPHLIQRLRKAARLHLEKIGAKVPELLSSCKSHVELSSPTSQRTVLLPFDQACRSYGPPLETFHELCMKGEKDSLFFCHLALCQDGFFLYIPPNTQESIQIVYRSSQESIPRLHIILGAHASLHIQESGECSKTNRLVSFDIGPYATVEHTVCEKTSRDKAHTFVRASLKKGASFTSKALLASHQTLNTRVFLEGEEARCDLQGAWWAKEHDTPAVQTHIEHRCEKTHSTQLFKGIVEEKAHAYFSGLVTIQKGANRSTARQMNHNILLGDRATTVSKPELEIYADDVKAVHGSTTGRIDETACLYMQTKGIPKDIAQKILLESFIREIGVFDGS